MIGASKRKLPLTTPMAKILTTLGANNGGLYNRIRKFEAEVVETGLDYDFFVNTLRPITGSLIPISSA
jgi:hypothetical protein